MSDHLEDLADAVSGLLKSRDRHDSTSPPGLDASTWRELAALGFTSLTVPEALGGSGGNLRDAAVVVGEAARFGAAAPIAEATFLAGPLLTAAGIELPPGVVTSGTGTLAAASGCVNGTLRQAPWLRSADYVVALATTGDGMAAALIATAADGLSVEPGENLAGEQRDTAALAGVAPLRLATLPPGDWARQFELYGAAARAVQIGGAARAVLDLSVAHARERVQFGRPLSRFQAVQHLLARLAADTVTVTVAADAAVWALVGQDSSAELLIASAKAQASTLASAIAAAGHQIHGAIGYTMEHSLGALTKRLWSWRQEHGNELYWQRQITGLIDSAPAGLWPLISDPASTSQPVPGHPRPVDSQPPRTETSL